jgi:hypothetical protein
LGILFNHKEKSVGLVDVCFIGLSFQPQRKISRFGGQIGNWKSYVNVEKFYFPIMPGHVMSMTLPLAFKWWSRRRRFCTRQKFCF